jgi:cytochrome c-type biogenesis protein CcmH
MSTIDARGDPGRTRRRFLRSALAAAIVSAAAWERLAAQEPLAGGGPRGALRDPTAAGRSRGPTAPGDNDERIKRIEQQLRCTCGCNLDIFTCRTTDFTCTYSPELHQEVLALHDDGKTAQQILDAFVAKYGEKTLMAPKPVGFNLWGYLLPGVAITVGAVLLALVIGRRERRQSLALVATEGGDPVRQDRHTADPVTATPEELDHLRKALLEVED